MSDVDTARAEAVVWAMRRTRQAEAALTAAVARRERLAGTVASVAQHEASRHVWLQAAHAALEAESTVDAAWRALETVLADAGVI